VQSDGNALERVFRKSLDWAIGDFLLATALKRQFCNTSHLLIDRPRNTDANRTADLDFPHREYPWWGKSNDLSLDDGYVLAVPSYAASTLHPVQSGVPPRSQKSDTCYPNLA
jgi:hypothetical protein